MNDKSRSHISRYFTFIIATVPGLLACSNPVSAQSDNLALYQNAVCVDTNVGEFCLEMFADVAPGTVENFLNYVNSGRYNGTVIHRSTPGFAIAGGGFYSATLPEEVPKDDPITNEFSRLNERGTIAMAKQVDDPNSASNQWYINLADNTTLDTTNGGYTVFGKVITGMNIVDDISHLNRADAASELGPAFSDIPVTSIGDHTVTAENMVQVNRVYVTDVMADPGNDGTVAKGPVINSGKHYFNSLCFNSTLGEFCMNLMPEYAPNTVANFLSYLNEGLYDGVMFNSAISSARVETGYFYADPAGSPVPQKAPVANEFGLSNQRGTVALVHPEGKPDEGTSGWIVNLANNSGFYDPASADDKDFAYSVFGEVISGLNVLTRSSFADKLYLQDNLGEKFFSVPVLRNGFSSPEEAAQAVEDGDYQFDSLKSNDLYRITSHFYRDVFVPDLSPEELQAETENACVADWVESINPETVCVSTNMGEFCMELLPEAAPATVKNFLHYIADGDYKNTLIHRSVANFVIQGGGYMLNKIGNAVPQDNPVQNEFSVSNTRGTVAMARLSGAVNSATSEWFVNLTDNSSPLDVTDEGFTVFARVIGDGMQVVDAIAGLGIFDFSFLNSAFSSLPVTEFDPAKGLDVNKLVIVNDIYMPGIPDHGCFASRTSALSTYRNNVFTVPTRIGDRIYKLEFGLLTFSPEIIFSVNTSNIQSQVDRGQETASFDWATGELVIPTLKVDSSILRNVRFRLSNADTLEFTYVDRDD